MSTPSATSPKKTWAPGQNGKGDAPRIHNFEAYRSNHERIFGRPKAPLVSQKREKHPQTPPAQAQDLDI